MSGWIPCRKGLWLSPEVARISRCLNLSPYEVTVRLLMLWTWADEESTDGVIQDADLTLVDHVTGVPGFGQAMIEAGWLLEGTGQIIFPRWERWNLRSAKLRAQGRERQRRLRERRRVEAAEA